MSQSDIAAGPPQRLGAAFGRVRGAGQDEEQIRKAVQVDDRETRDTHGLRRRHRLPLCTTRDRASDVQLRSRLGATGKHEALQWLELLVERVAPPLERIDLLL